MRKLLRTHFLINFNICFLVACFLPAVAFAGDEEALVEMEAWSDKADHEGMKSDRFVDQEHQFTNKSKIGNKEHRFFVTSDFYDGYLQRDFAGKSFADGLDGADYRCQWHADLEARGGKWQAVLGSQLDRWREQIEQSGVVTDETGALISGKPRVWTGIGANCEGWTSDSNEEKGDFYRIGLFAEQVTENSTKTLRCQSLLRLLCIEK